MPKKDTETLSHDNEEVLDLPDDEFLEQSENTDNTSDEDNVSDETSLEEEGEKDEETTEETSETDTTEETETEEDREDTEETTDNSEDTESNTGKQPDEEEPDNSDESSKDVNYQDFYSKIMKPFKANGKMITPESEEDVVSLMQMGANYVKKMATIKPALKAISSLEKNNIDDDELNYLIDLKNKKPEAIKKFIKDANIDPTEIDLEEDIDYKPSNNLATEEEAIFNDAIKEIQDSEYFDQTKKIVTEMWDSESKERLLKNPDLLKKLNEELELERFDKVQSIVDRERVFGRLNGVSDLDAYIMTVSKLTQESTDKAETPKTEKKVTPVNKTGNKKAAKPSPTKQKPKSVKYTDDEILNMSDEAFLNLEKKKLY